LRKERAKMLELIKAQKKVSYEPTPEQPKK